MRKMISKSEAKKKIEEFFQRENFSPIEVKKIKKLAMKLNLKLRDKKKNFCNKCLSKLKGKIRINQIFKRVTCENCGAVNRLKIQ